MTTHIHIHRTKDASSEEDFKARVTDINQLLTSASRKAESLSAIGGDSGQKAKAKKLEDLIDEARRYAFSIR